MIVFSTGRSPTEKMLHSYATKFFSGLPRDGKSLHLKSPASVSKNLLQELQRRTGVPLFFFGHGLNPPATGFLGDDGKPAIEAKTIRYLARRKVVATCCHGDGLAQWRGATASTCSATAEPTGSGSNAGIWPSCKPRRWRDRW